MNLRSVVPLMLSSYEAEASDLLGEAPEARILWDKRGYAFEALQLNDPRQLEELLVFVRTCDRRWRSVVE